MLCKNKLANLDFKSKKIMQNTFCFPFFFFIIKKNPKMKCMMLCNANPRNKESKKQKKQNKEQWSQRVEQ